MDDNVLNEMIRGAISRRFEVENEIETDGNEDLVSATGRKAENMKINRKDINWTQAFHDIFIEILKLDAGYHNAKETYTTSLLESGSHENPQALYQYLDMLTSRLEKIHLVKRVCSYLGLHGEMDEIMKRELDLIYSSKGNSASKYIEIGGPIAGEVRK